MNALAMTEVVDSAGDSMPPDESRTIPVGAGRRSFIVDLVTTPVDGAAPAVVLVAPRAHLVRLWAVDLKHRLGGQVVARLGAGGDGRPQPGVVLVATPTSLLRHAAVALPEPTVLVVDEPQRLSVQQRGHLAGLAVHRRVWLHLEDASPAGDPSPGAAASYDRLGRPQPEQGPDARPLLRSRDVEVGRTIASLLDAELDQRTPVPFESWAASHLGADGLRPYFSIVSGHWQDLVALNLAAVLPEATTVTGPDGTGDPRWSTLTAAATTVDVPQQLRAVFPAGTLGMMPIAVSLTRGDTTTVLHVAGPARASRDVIEKLKTARIRDGHPYRGATLELSEGRRELTIAGVQRPTDRREDLILPDSIWRVVDRDLLGVLRHRERLRDLGLGVNRGVLFHGPPGTGKTQLVRTVLAELGTDVTALLLRPEVLTSSLPEAYELAQLLAPSVVVLEDADLALKARGEGTSAALSNFLNSLDGLMVDHSGVLTIATTNNVASLDSAATRAARFDQIVEVPLPPPLGRERLWNRYLRGIDGQFDIAQLTRCSEDCSGADIREVVRAAILDTDGLVTMSALVAALRERTADPLPAGLYL